ncbi:MAG: DUF305 domain-containing protein [Longimicrobiales bacterium]
MTPSYRYLLGPLAATFLASACASPAPSPEPAAAPAPEAPGASAPDRPRPAASDAPLVQPGAPGQATRTFDASDLENLGGVEWTEADARFMQMMIPHHAQALEMTALVRRHATTEAVRQMALRMEISQRDEIALMERWLRERDQDVPEWEAHMGHGMAHAMGGDGEALMPGMLTPAQMEELRNARGRDFDRLFLRYMIQHHEGARVMVRDLFMARGGGQESEIFQFASHVDADQTAEIQRMQGLLDAWSR